MNVLKHLLHDALIGTENVSNAAIIRRKDHHLAACTAGFDLDPDSCRRLVDAFKNTALLRNDGFHFRGRTFMCVRADRHAIYGKHDNHGLILVRTDTLVIVGTYTDTMYPSVCVEALEKLREYFKEKGK